MKIGRISDVGEAHLQLLLPPYAVVRSAALRGRDNTWIDEVGEGSPIATAPGVQLSPGGSGKQEKWVGKGLHLPQICERMYEAEKADFQLLFVQNVFFIEANYSNLINILGQKSLVAAASTFHSLSSTALRERENRRTGTLEKAHL